jgi:hypothetical protein
VTGPRDVIGDRPVGVLSDDLRAACLRALSLSRRACRAHALGYSWENSARQFIGHLTPAEAGRARDALRQRARRLPAAETFR